MKKYILLIPADPDIVVDAVHLIGEFKAWLRSPEDTLILQGVSDVKVVELDTDPSPDVVIERV